MDLCIQMKELLRIHNDAHGAYCFITLSDDLSKICSETEDILKEFIIVYPHSYESCHTTFVYA